MKILFFIFSLYLLILPFVPCEDVTECESREDLTVALSNEHEDHEESEACAPFCYCACCSITSIGVTPSNILNIPPSEFSVYITEQHKLPASIKYTIWQPPKIS